MPHLVQIRLLERLEDIHPLLGEMYSGAVDVLECDHPEKIPQSALSIRELVEALLRHNEITNSNTLPNRRTGKDMRAERLGEFYDLLGRGAGRSGECSP